MTNVGYSEAVNKPRKGVIPGPIMPRYPLQMKMGERATTISPSNSYKPVQEDQGANDDGEIEVKGRLPDSQVRLSRRVNPPTSPDHEAT